MQNKTTVLFDFDGTLADTLAHLLHISNRFSGIYGYKRVEENEIDSYRSKKTRQAIRDLNIPVLLIPRIANRIKSALQEEMHLVQPIPFIKEVTSQLYKYFRLGIVTSNSSANVSLFLKNHDMPWFSIIHTESSIFGKSRVLKHVLKENNLSAEEVTYVGDEIRDIEASQKSGIDMIAVSWGMNNAETLNHFNPSHLVHHPSEILELFIPDVKKFTQ